MKLRTLYSVVLLVVLSLCPLIIFAQQRQNEFHTSSHSGAATWSASDPNAGIQTIQSCVSKKKG